MQLTVDHHLSEARIHTVYHWLDQYADWAQGRTLETQRKAMQGSVNFFVMHAENLVGYGRVITDGATFSHLSDVIVPPESRGQGISRVLMQHVMAHEAANYRMISLNTSSAQGLYEKFGFTPPGENAATYMRIIKTPA